MSYSVSQDPRKQDRLHHGTIVSWAADVQAASGRSLPLRVIEVAQGGIGVVSDDALPATGTFVVTLHVPAPGNPGQISMVKVQTRVVHQVFTAGRNRAGLEFVQVPPADAEFLMGRAQKRG